jgi:hypothetical protein
MGFESVCIRPPSRNFHVPIFGPMSFSTHLFPAALYNRSSHYIASLSWILWQSLKYLALVLVATADRRGNGREKTWEPQILRCQYSGGNTRRYHGRKEGIRYNVVCVDAVRMKQRKHSGLQSVPLDLVDRGNRVVTLIQLIIVS